MPKTLELTVELERLLLRELRELYVELNATYFRRKLTPAALLLSEARGRLGLWDPATRTIELSRDLVTQKPWGATVEVMKHEMAHQYVHEVLKQTAEPAHGPTFRDLCLKLGIDSRSQGLPESNAEEVPEDKSRIQERIRKLLALAESANVNEAEAAMSAAQRLILKYNIDSTSQGTARTYGFRHLGQPTGRVSEGERIVGAILTRHFFVECIWVPVYRVFEKKRGSVLEVCGTEANLDMAEYVHAFLLRTAEQLWDDQKKRTGERSNRERRTYVAGVMTGFLEKLNRERQTIKEEGLVWVRDADLKDFYHRRNPRIQTVRYAGSARTSAHEKGKEAGRTLVLHRPVEGKATGATPRLLGPRASS